MYSVKNVFWKFQEKFFKNNCDSAYFLYSSRLIACNFTINELFCKLFEGFFLYYQRILFPEQLFMGHSWWRVPSSSYVIKIPLYCLPHLFKILSNSFFCWFQPSPPCFFWCLVSLTEWVNVPHLMCYFT